MRTETQKMLLRMDDGEKVKCPVCRDGMYYKHGNNVYKCDKCDSKIVLRVKLEHGK